MARRLTTEHDSYRIQSYADLYRVSGIKAGHIGRVRRHTIFRTKWVVEMAWETRQNDSSLTRGFDSMKRAVKFLIDQHEQRLVAQGGE